MPRRRTSCFLAAVLFPALLLVGCDRQTSQPFSVQVRVETEQGSAVDSADVAVRPCYAFGDEVACDSDEVFGAPSWAPSRPPDRSVAPSSASTPSPADAEIFPIHTNPIDRSTNLRLEVVIESTVQSTVHTLSGRQARAIVDGSVAAGTHVFQWRPEDLPDGLYRIRTLIRTGQAVAARDTAVAAIARDPSKAALIGSTDSSGRVSTRRRFRFPSLFSVPALGVRDAEQNRLGEMRVADTVQFVVTTSEQQHTFRRSVSTGKNTFTFTVSP